MAFHPGKTTYTAEGRADATIRGAGLKPLCYPPQLSACQTPTSNGRRVQNRAAARYRRRRGYVTDHFARSVLAKMKAQARGRHSVETQPERVLIVDDDRSVREFVDQVLRRAGYVTGTAAGGHEALRMAEDFHPDLLLTDVMMPQMTGDELARQLRVKEPDLKVLYLTGYADRLFNEKGTLWEHEAFLEKPSTIDGILEGVRLLLRTRNGEARKPIPVSHRRLISMSTTESPGSATT